MKERGLFLSVSTQNTHESGSLNASLWPESRLISFASIYSSLPPDLPFQLCLLSLSFLFASGFVLCLIVLGVFSFLLIPPFLIFFSSLLNDNPICFWFILSFLSNSLFILTFSLSPFVHLPNRHPSLSLLSDRPSGLSQAFLMASSRADAAEPRAVIGCVAWTPPRPPQLGWSYPEKRHLHCRVIHFSQAQLNADSLCLCASAYCRSFISVLISEKRLKSNQNKWTLVTV